MRIIKKQLSFNEANPFGSDFFDRKKVSDNLIHLIKNDIGPLIISLNGTWGEGKTTFVNQLMGEARLINDPEIIPIYYNSFSNDFSDQPFISIAVTIQEVLHKVLEGEISKNHLIKEYKKKAKELGTNLIKAGAAAAITGITFNGFSLFGSYSSIKKGIDNIDDFTKKLDKNKNKALIDDKYDAFLDLRRTILEYQDILGEIIKNKKCKLLIVVDELDRCKPSFSIEVIESIKHLFLIEDVFYLLAVNKDQLVSSIRHEYGFDDKDSTIYWEKFIDLEVNLPEFNTFNIYSKDEINKVESFIESLQRLHEIDENLISSRRVAQLFLIFNQVDDIKIVPRTIEKIFALFCAIGKAKGIYYLSEFNRRIFFIITLKIALPEFYHVLLNEDIGFIKNLFLPVQGSNLRKKYNIERQWNGNTLNLLRNKYFIDGDITITDDKTDEFTMNDQNEIFDTIQLFDIPYVETVSEKYEQMLKDFGK